MDISYLLEYVNLITLGICLCVGYVLKTAIPRFPNRYIPLIALLLGCITNIIVNVDSGINGKIVLGGMISGLSSTGFYEMIRNLLESGNLFKNKKNCDNIQEGEEK